MREASIFLDSTPCFPSNLHFIEEGYQKKVFLCLLSIWITQQCLAALNPALTFAPFCFNFPPFFSSWWFLSIFEKKQKKPKQGQQRKLKTGNYKYKGNFANVMAFYTEKPKKGKQSSWHIPAFHFWHSFDTKSDFPHLDSNISLFLFNVPGVIFLFWPVIISISYSF